MHLSEYDVTFALLCYNRNKKLCAKRNGCHTVYYKVFLISIKLKIGCMKK